MKRTEARYRPVLDNLDGTRPFTTICYILGTLIAVTREEMPSLGAIASPSTGHLLIGLGREQTQLNDKPLRVRDCRDIEDTVVLTTGHWDTVSWPDGHAFLQLSRGARIYRTSGDCHAYFRVVTGSVDVMLDPTPKHVGHVCAGAGDRKGGGSHQHRCWTSLQGSDLLATSDALQEDVQTVLMARI